MNSELRKDKAIQQLLEIEQEFEELRNSKRFIPLRDPSKPESSDETNRLKLQKPSDSDCRSLAKDILQNYGRNLPFEEIEKVFESEPWPNGFHTATISLMQRYDFLKNTAKSDERQYTPTEESFKAFKASGVISETEITKIIEDFKIPDAMAQARENLTCVYTVLKEKNEARTTPKETTNDSTAENVTGQAQKLHPKKTGSILTIKRKISKGRKQKIAAALKLDTITDVEVDFDESDAFSTVSSEIENFSLRDIPNHPFKLSNVFPSYLCKRTSYFMFPSLKVAIKGKPSTDAECLTQYKNICLKLAENTSANAVGFCKRAKVACAMLISIFEDLFCLFQHSQISSYVETQYGKLLMLEIFSEMYVLECEIVDQKRRCTKFLIDADIFLYHDPPLSKRDGAWSDQQRYMWQIAIIRSKLCIQQLEVLISKLKEAQTEFVAQYKAFLAFCKLNLK